MVKIENLNYTIKKNINFVFFRKFITALFPKLKKECKFYKLILSQFFDSQLSETKQKFIHTTNLKFNLVV